MKNRTSLILGIATAAVLFSVVAYIFSSATTFTLRDEPIQVQTLTETKATSQPTKTSPQLTTEVRATTSVQTSTTEVATPIEPAPKTTSGMYRVLPPGFYPEITVHFRPNQAINGKEAFLFADTQHVLQTFGISTLPEGCTYHGTASFTYHVVSEGKADSDFLPTIALDKLISTIDLEHDLVCSGAL